jgi:hypothetical protein
VESFGVDDPLMLALAFFQDLWMFEAPMVLSKWEVQERDLLDETVSDREILPELLDHLDRHTDTDAMRRLRSRLPQGWPCHKTPQADDKIVFGPVPSWFGTLLANCLKSWHTGSTERGDFRFKTLIHRVQRASKAADGEPTPELREQRNQR